VTASTTTTILGVSIFSRQRKRKADVFDIALSPEGIVIRRPGRADQHMSWERISQWEITERPGCVVLTLRGGGSVTPLMVKGWTPDDLETVMRQAAEGTAGPAASEDAPPPVPALEPEAASNGAASPGDGPAGTRPVRPRAARRPTGRRPRRGSWKPIVTVVLLGVLATAVTLVLLQSAGIISWGFLGPTA
jgi:hypothetical protein